jgi:hypothetical protein
MSESDPDDAIGESELFSDSEGDEEFAGVAYFHAPINSFAALYRLQDWVDDYLYTLVHTAPTTAPVPAATLVANGLLKTFKVHPVDAAWAGQLLASTAITTFADARVAARSLSDGGEATRGVYEQEKRVVGELLKAAGLASPKEDPPAKDDGSSAKASTDPLVLAQVRQRLDRYWKSDATVKGFALETYWAQFTSALSVWQGVGDEARHAAYFAALLENVMNLPEDSFDVAQAPQPADGERKWTIAEALNVAFTEEEMQGVVSTNVYSRKWDFDPDKDERLDGSVNDNRPGLLRDGLYSFAPFTDVRKPVHGAAPGGMRYGRTPRGARGEVLKVRLGAGTAKEGAVARVVFIHPLAGMRVRVDGELFWLHNASNWTWET